MTSILSSSLQTTLGWFCILVLSACASQEKTGLGDDASMVIGNEMTHVRYESMKLILRLLNEGLVPGLSVALVDRDGPVWVEGFGKANIETKERVDARTVFRAGSVSKPITALAVMQLQQDGVIDIDRPLISQMDGFNIKRHSRHTGVVTPRQLLSHHSGLPSDLLKGMFSDTSFRQVTALLQDTYLASTPGTRFNYSNLGYDLLGILIEQHSEQAFNDYVAKRLTTPLGMMDSGFELMSRMERRHSAGHLDDRVYSMPHLRDTPALGFHTTAFDMSLFVRALLKAEVPGLTSQDIDAMWESQNHQDTSPMQNNAGLGWFVENHPDYGRLVRHGGSTRLFGAEIALLPGSGLGVVVLTNSAHSSHLARELAAAILSLAASTKTTVEKLRLAKVDIVDGQSIPIASGGYATSLGLLLVADDRTRLCACIIERILDLTRFEDGSFGLSQESAASLPESYRILGDLRFTTREQEGDALLVARYQGGELVLGKRIDETGLDTAWSRRLGNYEVINPDGDFKLENLRLSEQEGVLCLHYRAPGLSDSEVRLPLLPISDRAALVQGVERGAGETVEIINIDGQACLRFSGFIGMPTQAE
jgi:CubicO group peptidase (beta-lactamase class C family)